MWLTFALLAVVFRSGQNFAEKASQNKLGSRLTALMVMVISSLMLLPMIIGQAPQLGKWFWPAILMSCGLYLAAKPMRLYALGNGEISKIVPLFSLQVIISLFLGIIVLKEYPTWWGLVGVLLMVGGSFLVIGFNSQALKLASRKVLFYLFVSLILGALMQIIDKVAINNSYPKSPNLVIFWETILCVPLFLLILPDKGKDFKKLAKPINWKLPILIGFLYSLKNLFGYNALSDGYVAYVAAINQLALFLAVWGGKKFLKEKMTLRQMAGAVIIAVGAVLIGVWG